jgi:methyl-accepting chemotaxis protein
MEERLARVIVDMTESSTLELTEHVYSLAEKSRLLSDKIRDHLESLTTGESSLAVEISTLRREVNETNLVIEQFREVREQQFTDMKTVSTAVQSVGEYIATISELAEQTGILAINASIEAARAGNVGKGFAVIAGEVHKLADASRDVAVSIGKTLESARLSINDSFLQQNGRIEDAVSRLEKGQADQLRRADILFPHVEKIGAGIASTRAISDMVQKELDNISASLQSQDSVRQILEHMIQFLQDLRERASGAGFREDPHMTGELEDILVRHFTTRAEWQAFGRSIDETLQKNEKSMEKDNITLF